jgi:hypothetical protein
MHEFDWMSVSEGTIGGENEKAGRCSRSHAHGLSFYLYISVIWPAGTTVVSITMYHVLRMHMAE